MKKLILACLALMACISAEARKKDPWSFRTDKFDGRFPVHENDLHATNAYYCYDAGGHVIMDSKFGCDSTVTFFIREYGVYGIVSEDLVTFRYSKHSRKTYYHLVGQIRLKTWVYDSIGIFTGVEYHMLTKERFATIKQRIFERIPQ